MSGTGAASSPFNGRLLLPPRASLYTAPSWLSSLTTPLLGPLGPFMASGGICRQHTGLAGFYWIFSSLLTWSCGRQGLVCLLSPLSSGPSTSLLGVTSPGSLADTASPVEEGSTLGGPPEALQSPSAVGRRGVGAAWLPFLVRAGLIRQGSHAHCFCQEQKSSSQQRPHVCMLTQEEKSQEYHFLIL